MLRKINRKFVNFTVMEADKPLLDQLSPAHRAILADTRTMEETAMAEGIAVGTVKSRRHRARTELTRLRQETAP